MKVTPVVPQRHHIDAMVNHLPEEQHREIERYDGGDIVSTLQEAQQPGKQLYALVHENGKTLGMTGCTTQSGVSGVIGGPWVLTTVWMQDHVRDFLKTAKILNDHYAHYHTLLVADVDAEYEPGLKLMKFLGYEERAKVVSPMGYPFIQFQIRRPVWGSK